MSAIQTSFGNPDCAFPGMMSNADHGFTSSRVAGEDICAGRFVVARGTTTDEDINTFIYPISGGAVLDQQWPKGVSRGGRGCPDDIQEGCIFGVQENGFIWVEVDPANAPTNVAGFVTVDVTPGSPTQGMVSTAGATLSNNAEYRALPKTLADGRVVVEISIGKSL